MSNKKDTFKKKATVVELNKVNPQENIVDVIEFKEYGFPTGMCVAVEYKEGIFYASNYQIEDYDIFKESKELLKILQDGYENVVKNNIYNREFLLDQIVMQHIKDSKLYEKDMKKYGVSSSLEVLENFKKEEKSAIKILEKIMNEKRRGNSWMGLTNTYTKARNKENSLNKMSNPLN